MRAVFSACLVATALIAAGLAGCVGNDEALPAGPSRDPCAYDTSHGWSMPCSPALHDILPGEAIVAASFDGTPIGMGLFRPAIASCDWDNEEQPEACRLPVVLSAGPYWGPNTAEASVRPPLVDWLVPRGYAVVQMSLRGSGASGGCMETKSMNEQRDLDHMVTWLAEQGWSNGNIGMTGRSYVGTTPFMAAASGNPYLKTIVPIVGLTDWSEWIFKNGTMDPRSNVGTLRFLLTHGFGLDDGGDADHRMEHWTDQLCEENLAHLSEEAQALLTGDASSEYWRVRDFKDRVVEAYRGSMWVIHGLQDFNVRPSQVIPWFAAASANGIETKAWLGQWGHHYPDRVDEHPHVRWDFADELVRWFDWYLKGEGEPPVLDVEVQDHLGVWRNEATYPPTDAAWQRLELGADGTLATDTAATGMLLLANGVRARFESATLAEPLRIAGPARLHVTMTPSSTEAGDVFAELYDVWPDGREIRIGVAQLNLAFHAGGNTERQAVIPGEAVVARMELEPMDASIATGHRLLLVLHRDGIDDVPPFFDPALPNLSPAPLLLMLGDGQSTLRLGAIERDRQEER